MCLFALVLLSLYKNVLRGVRDVIQVQSVHANSYKIYKIKSVMGCLGIRSLVAGSNFVNVFCAGY